MRPPPDPRPFYKSLQPLLLWQTLPRPVDWDAIFGRAAPREVEIGIGNGDYLARNAAERPAVDFVGVELRWASVKRSLRNLEKTRVNAKAGNVRLVIEDARPALERLFGARALARVHVLFPCPWQKERHERHRLFHADFLRLLNHRLADGGEIFCVTDWEPFVAWTLGQLPGTGFSARVEAIEARFGTKYERKWLGRGQQRFHEIPVASVMSREIVSIKAEDDVARTFELLRRHQLHRLPILDERSQLVGVVSLTDLARTAARKRAPECDQLRAKVAATLAEVGRPRALASTG